MIPEGERLAILEEQNKAFRDWLKGVESKIDVAILTMHKPPCAEVLAVERRVLRIEAATWGVGKTVAVIASAIILAGTVITVIISLLPKVNIAG